MRRTLTLSERRPSPLSAAHNAIKALKHSGGYEMRLSRRTILRGAAALPLATGNFGLAAFAQAPSALRAPVECRPYCSCMAMVTTRHSGSPLCGGWN